MKTLGFIVLCLIVLAAIVCGPLVTIFALNVLFSLAIPYSLKTWFATFWLAGVITAGKYASKD